MCKEALQARGEATQSLKQQIIETQDEVGTLVLQDQFESNTEHIVHIIHAGLYDAANGNAPIEKT